MMRTIGLFFVIIVLMPLQGFTASNSRWFALYGQYHTYTDIRGSEEGEDQELSDDYSLNLDIRLVRIFILTLHGGQSVDSQRTNLGAGFKVDLPGFFMIGGSVYDLIRKRKRDGVNTSIHWKTYVITEQNQERQYVGNRFSFSTDFKVSKNAFMNIDLGLYSHQGNQFFSPTLGLGYEF